MKLWHFLKLWRVFLWCSSVLDLRGHRTRLHFQSKNQIRLKRRWFTSGAQQLPAQSPDWPPELRRVFRGVQLTVKAARVCGCRFVCSLFPSCGPLPPAASSEWTRSQSAPGSPLWTPDTPTPAEETAGNVILMLELKLLKLDHNHHRTSSKCSFLNMEMLTWLSRPIFAWNFLIPSLSTPGWNKTMNTFTLANRKTFLLRSGCLEERTIKRFMNYCSSCAQNPYFPLHSNVQ